MYQVFIAVDFIHKNINELLHHEIIQINVSYTNVPIRYEHNDLATKSDNLLGGNKMSLIILYNTECTAYPPTETTYINAS
jgi:hypothetical protein